MLQAISIAAKPLGSRHFKDAKSIQKIFFKIGMLY
jgi:hypothetical protein